MENPFSIDDVKALLEHGSEVMQRFTENAQARANRHVGVYSGKGDLAVLTETEAQASARLLMSMLEFNERLAIMERTFADHGIVLKPPVQYIEGVAIEPRPALRVVAA